MESLKWNDPLSPIRKLERYLRRQRRRRRRCLTLQLTVIRNGGCFISSFATVRMYAHTHTRTQLSVLRTRFPRTQWFVCLIGPVRTREGGVGFDWSSFIFLRHRQHSLSLPRSVVHNFDFGRLPTGWFRQKQHTQKNEKLSKVSLKWENSSAYKTGFFVVVAVGALSCPLGEDGSKHSNRKCLANE